MIDYLDLLSTTKLLIPNVDAVDHEECYIVDNYKFNVLLNLELTCINGISCINQTDGATINDKKEILKRSNIPVGNIYLQLIHEDLT